LHVKRAFFVLVKRVENQTRRTIDGVRWFTDGAPSCCIALWVSTREDRKHARDDEFVASNCSKRRRLAA
jgi:hypothetical protein